MSEGGVAAGVRRIEAVTGQGAFDYVPQTEHRLRDVAGLVRGSRDDVEEKVRQLLERSRRLEKEVAQLKDKLASGQGRDVAAEAATVGGLKVVATIIEGADAAALRNAVDQLKSRLGSAVIVLGSADADGKVTLIAGVTADATGKVKAGELVNFVAQQVGGRGGGRPDLAQAGGTAGRAAAGGHAERRGVGPGAGRILSSGPGGPDARNDAARTELESPDTADFFAV